jgi:hypothetical protein
MQRLFAVFIISIAALAQSTPTRNFKTKRKDPSRPGKLADMVLLSDDLFTIAREDTWGKGP